MFYNVGVRSTQSKVGDNMEQQEDTIVDIPPNRVKFFGTPGKMLLPSPATVAALVEKIPERKVMTTDLLRQRLTEQFNVQGTCPVTTKKALQAIANDSSKHVAYWRVINQNGGLIAGFPGGVMDQATRLGQEGFTIQIDRKTPKVQNFRENLVSLD
jgi:hypothetical protein